MLYLQDPIHLKSFTSHPVLVVNPISAFALAEGSVSHAGSIALACFRACLVATTMNRVVKATEASSMVFHSGCQALVLSFCQPHLLKSGTSCCDDKDYLLTYLLTYARLLAGSMGHRSKLSTGSCAAPWLQFPARCTPSSSLPTSRLAARCPLFLFPWRFHVRACLVMLVVGFLSV